jgi:tetratricopeptide (TPR) repeat protein
VASKREALIASAEKSLQKGKVDAALKDYLKVLEETPNDINVLNKVGDLNVRLGKNDDSIIYFLRIAEHYARDGFYVRAIAMYKKINKLDPARLEIYEKLAELYVKQQLWMEAKSNYQVLADYLLKQDNLQGAIGIYQKMVAIEPQNLQLHVKLADLFTQGKRIPEALREYGVVAAALSERGAQEEAIRVYEKALKLAPDNVEILKTLVPLLLSINALEQARGVLRKGLEASPRSVPLFLLSAEAAVAANDMAEARSYSDKARAVEPDNEEVLAAAVRIQLKGRRPDLAWAAAAPLADAAMKRGEAKKALAILVPIARAAPDVDDLVKRVVDIAAGIGDETTALPFRSALAELYRKKGKLAEAADLLRHCASVQPDNAEFRARLAQLEPQLGSVSVLPQRLPPPSLERRLEVSLSGFEAQPLRPIVAPPAPVPPAPETVETADEFEFDLDEAEVAEATEAAPPEEAPVATPTPPRGLVAPRAEMPVEAEPTWSSMSAAEALEAYEASQAAAGQGGGARLPAPAEVIEELQPEAEIPSAAAIRIPDLSDLDLAPPEGFDLGLSASAATFEVPPVGPEPLPEVSWPSTALPEPEGAAVEEPPALLVSGIAARPSSLDTALEDALVEVDVFRKYGLLEKALDQLSPWLERAPGNLRVRERLFEIQLEHGDRAAAREHAAILSEAYAAEGREDRIRGLEALLGEPLRAAAPGAPSAAEERPAPAEPEPPPAEPERAHEEPGHPPVEAELAAVELDDLDLSPAALPAEVPEAGILAAAEPLLEELAPGEAPSPEFGFVPAVSPLSTFLEEPPTEVIPPLGPVPPAQPEAVFAVPLEGVTGEPAPSEEVRLEPPAAELVHPEAPAPEPQRAPSARARISPEELLGFGKAAPAGGGKKVKAVRPEDVELDLLGAKAQKPKEKPGPPKKEKSVPDDLLQSIRKAVSPAPTASSAGPPREATPVADAPPPAVPVFAAEERPGLPAAVEAPALPAAVPEVLAPAAAVGQPSAEELAGLDFCLDQGMVVDAAERLQSLEGRFPGDTDLAARRLRLEGGRGSGGEVPRAALHDILSDDLDSVLDAQLGKALTEDMVRELPAESVPAPTPSPGAPIIDESGLFSDEQEFFNFADELHTELRRDGEVSMPEEGREVSLEEIFRDFKKGVEQQLSPEDFETHYNLGIAYKEMGLTDEAIGEFQLAAKDPLHAVECCAMLGLCFLEKGLPQLAVRWYRKGLETIGVKEDDKLGLQYALSGVLEQIGDREGAYRTYLDIFGANASYRDVADRIKELKPFVAP